MFFVPLLSIVLLLAIPTATNAEYYGWFEGEVITKWDVEGRKMILTQPFRYIDPAGGRWHAPKGAVIDGASIPRFAWSIIGGPFEGKYRNASVIHDIACIEKKRPWELVHLTFYYAMRAAGVDSTLASIMYAAVYHFGPRWTVSITDVVPKRRVEDSVKRIKQQHDPKSQFDVAVGPAIMGRREHSGDRQIIDVVITPPDRDLSETQFDELKNMIEKGVPVWVLGPRPVSLEEIRNFRPSEQQ